MRQPQYGSYVLHSHAPRLLTSWHVLSRPCSRPGECRDGADDDQPCSGSSQAVRELPESLSGIYRNACPRITEIRVREFAKPALGGSGCASCICATSRGIPGTTKEFIGSTASLS